MQYIYPARPDIFYSFGGISDSVSDLSKLKKKRKNNQRGEDGTWTGICHRWAEPHSTGMGRVAPQQAPRALLCHSVLRINTFSRQLGSLITIPSN